MLEKGEDVFRERTGLRVASSGQTNGISVKHEVRTRTRGYGHRFKGPDQPWLEVASRRRVVKHRRPVRTGPSGRKKGSRSVSRAKR